MHFNGIVPISMALFSGALLAITNISYNISS